MYSSLVRTIKIGLKIIFGSDLIMYKSYIMYKYKLSDFIKSMNSLI